MLTINLSPATLPKAGSHYDVAIVAAVLAAQGVFRAEELRGTILLGGLGLDDRLRPIRGIGASRVVPTVVTSFGRGDAGEGVSDGSYRCLTSRSYISKSDPPYTETVLAFARSVLTRRIHKLMHLAVTSGVVPIYSGTSSAQTIVRS